MTLAVITGMITGHMITERHHPDGTADCPEVLSEREAFLNSSGDDDA